MEGRGPLFREIHKNTWLKRISVDNRKIAVGTKKPERCWVVFCVHDDSEALLEGYSEPRLAASHSPDWTVSLQTTLHISHALVPSEQEYEFVITLLTETVRFNAPSWEIMQEWVDTLRLKLREMKILSPKENLYSKMPEVRPPLLPTRDPMSPLPAPPPIPAAIVPGVERVIPISSSRNVTPPVTTSTVFAAVSAHSESTEPVTIDTVPTANVETLPTTSLATSATPSVNTSIPSTSMSNTLTQNLINMLSNPVSAYSNQLNGIASESETSSLAMDEDTESGDNSLLRLTKELSETSVVERINSDVRDESKRDSLPSLAQTFTNNVLSDPHTFASTSGLSSYVGYIRDTEHINDVETAESSSDSIASSLVSTPDPPIVIPRPQTVRSASSKNGKNRQIERVQPPIEPSVTEATATTNITIIQVSSPLHHRKERKDLPEISIEDDDAYKSNVQIIPSNFNPSNACNEAETNEPKVTTVQVSSGASASAYGKIIKKNPAIKSISLNTAVGTSATEINKSVTTETTAANTIRNFGPITNIPINADKPAISTTQLHYEQVFVTPPASASPKFADGSSSPKFNFGNRTKKPASQSEVHINRINLSKNDGASDVVNGVGGNGSTASLVTVSVASTSNQSRSNTQTSGTRPFDNTNMNIDTQRAIEPTATHASAVRPMLTRGVTEAIIQRPSRKDLNIVARGRSKGQPSAVADASTTNAIRNEVFEPRQRSSSTSDAQGLRSRSNINNNNANSQLASTGNQSNESRRTQRPTNEHKPTNPLARLTLREQQVLQLRREMMHPGGVRLQLRRKDCIGSIAFVDAFGGVWITGWKQKDHPMLYNALHIGDQVISIGGITVSSASDAHKIIRNSQNLFIEIIIRRIPFGRVYAIRRDIERQCLGLIRDGNTATIVDVVPNSLSARHGLPPKAQSCDGLSLTFWVLTEINGRPLNMFFKDHEVEDRLNSVGKDLSILVQPCDLVNNLKKQLKSLRNYKDYIVQ